MIRKPSFLFYTGDPLLSSARPDGVCGLGWADVDRDARRAYLRRAGSKNKKPHVIVLTGELAAIIERRWAARSVTRRDGATFVSDLVFHRNGRPVGDFRKAWAAACIAAGFCRQKRDADGTAIVDRKGRPVIEPTLRFHDFRRSAARNLRRAHRIGPEVGMKITGHETDAMWRRYSIVDEDDIEQALTAVQAYVVERAAEKADTKVVAISERRR